jgi:hypothetical protein
MDVRAGLVVVGVLLAIAPAGAVTPQPAGVRHALLTTAESRLDWTWMGTPTTAADFGTVSVNNGYALCFYDESAGATLVARALAHGDLRWRPLNSNQGWKFTDRVGRAEGLRTILLKATSSGRGILTVKGKGALLGLPTQPLGLPMRVQLQSRDGACWEATFSSSGTQRNDATTYTGNAD